MKIAVLGASGKVGKALTDVLLSREHQLNVLVHRKTELFNEAQNLHIVQGDVHDAASVQELIKGCDMVVSALGSWGTASRDIVSAATKNLIPAMHAAGIKRFVSVTGAAAITPGQKLNLFQSLSNTAMNIVSRGVLDDANEHLRLLSESTLDWTAIRAPIMTSEDSPNYQLGMKLPGMFTVISRKAVVLSMLAVIDYGTFSKQAPFISAK